MYLESWYSLEPSVDPLFALGGFCFVNVSGKATVRVEVGVGVLLSSELVQQGTGSRRLWQSQSSRIVLDWIARMFPGQRRGGVLGTAGRAETPEEGSETRTDTSPCAHWGTSQAPSST